MMPRLFFLALCCLLSSCASTPLNTDMTDPDWEISGKIGIRENALRATSSMFQWRQKDDRYSIFLLNSLGQIQLTIIGDKKMAIAQQPDGKTAKARTPEALLEKLTGWYFPVSSTRFWLQGIPRGDETDIQRTTEGFLTRFNTREWHANLGNYRAVDGVFLPHKIRLEQEKLSITLVVKQHAHFTP
jgi:outer membrane lipoprotein LolB